MVKISIKDSNYTIKLDNGKILRTPIDLILNNFEVDYFIMKLKYLGIMNYTVEQIDDNRKKELKPKPKKFVPIRPSRLYFDNKDNKDE